MINIDPKVQRIIDWRESFVTLPDNHFFELIRMYLGEIHSPFNKQKLVEQLGAFLRHESNRKTIISLLSESDILVLAAVYFIPETTTEKLAAFFSSSINFASLYERLLNLEERLLIYRHPDKNSKKTIISINPTLEDVLLPLLSKKILFPQPALERKNESAENSISPEKLAAFVNFIATNPGLCKADGTIKKRDSEKLELMFGSGTTKMFQLLMNGFMNLSLVKECNAGYEIDQGRLKAFAELPENVQYAYLCVASHGRFSRSALVKQSKLLLETINAIPATGFSTTCILRSAFLIWEAEKGFSAAGSSSSSGGRFAAMLARASEEEAAQSAEAAVNPTAVMDRLLESAHTLGLIEEYGIDEKGQSVFVKGSVLSKTAASGQELPKVLNIDAGFNVMIFPGLPFKELLPLMNFMDLKQFDTAATFEITRKSIMRSFDAGLKQNGIYSLMEKFCLYGVPENLKVSIEDWSNSYSSASLYRGYILKVDEKSTVIVENNPVIGQYISEVLAPGIFLLSVTTDEEAENLIKESGLDFIGSLQTAKKEVTGAVFPSFEINRNSRSVLLGGGAAQFTDNAQNLSDDDSSGLPTTEEERKAHFVYMRGLLDKMAVSPEQREGLLLRINRKIILTPQQLNADSVKLEQIEANGMDYQGKVHVAESAIQQNMMLELEFEDQNADGGIAVIVGTPVAVEKNSFDSAVRMIVEPEHQERSFSLGHARNVKRIRGSVLR